LTDKRADPWFLRSALNLIRKRSAQHDQPFLYKPVQDFRIVDLERRIDKFAENDGLSDLSYMEESSTHAFARINQQNSTELIIGASRSTVTFAHRDFMTEH
jgi:hypothetical protein